MSGAGAAAPPPRCCRRCPLGGAGRPVLPYGRRPCLHDRGTDLLGVAQPHADATACAWLSPRGCIADVRCYWGLVPPPARNGLAPSSPGRRALVPQSKGLGRRALPPFKPSSPASLLVKPVTNDQV